MFHWLIRLKTQQVLVIWRWISWLLCVLLIKKKSTLGAVSDFDGQDGTSPFIQSHKSVSSVICSYPNNGWVGVLTLFLFYFTFLCVCVCVHWFICFHSVCVTGLIKKKTVLQTKYCTTATQVHTVQQMVVYMIIHTHTLCWICKDCSLPLRLHHVYFLYNWSSV